ncbi:rCG55080 [Rattus norvegicus]|uniref:RCG55080 n=1 Tax=Rattus norvegicus TaxID=10116 RepID=A6IJ07_RAT|nr:rCG55080 [Rattus norvegicus]
MTGPEGRGFAGLWLTSEVMDVAAPSSLCTVASVP